MLAKNLASSEKWWKIPFRLLLDQVAAWKGLLNGDTGYFVTINRAHLAFLKWYFSAANKPVNNRIAIDRIKGVYKGNMIWQYFIRNRKHFSQIIH